MRQRGLLLLDVGLVLLRLLDRAGAGARQVGVADALLLGEHHGGLIGGDQGARLIDRHCLLLDLLPQIVDIGPGGGDIGACLIERGAVVAVVDAGHHLAGVHLLVVLDQHLVEVARDLGADEHGVRRHVGVVGLDLEAPDGPPVVAIHAGSGNDAERRRGKQQALGQAASALAGNRIGREGNLTRDYARATKGCIHDFALLKKWAERCGKAARRVPTGRRAYRRAG